MKNPYFDLIRTVWHYGASWRAFPQATIIVSLHRLHLLPQFDSVIMLKNGKIVASGATSDLFNQPGPVRDLWITYSV